MQIFETGERERETKSGHGVRTGIRGRARHAGRILRQDYIEADKRERESERREPKFRI